MTAISWKSGVSGDWSLSTNWAPASVPGAGDTVTIAAVSASPYTVTISLAEAASTLTLNSATASVQVDSTLTVGGALTLTNGTLDLVGVIKNGTLVLNGGSFVPGGGTLDGVKTQGSFELTQSFGPALVVKDGMLLANLAGTGGGRLDLTGLGASLDLAPGVQTLNSTVAGQISTIDIGSTSGDTITELNAAGTITTVTLGPLIDLVQVGTSARLTASSQVGDSLVNKGLITVAQHLGSFVFDGGLTIDGGAFANQGTITVSNGDTVTINSTSFSNTGTINVLNTGTLNIGQFGNWTSTGKITATDATVNLLGNVSTAELKAITSRTGGLIDLGGSLALGGGTLNVGTGTTLGDVLVSGTIAGGTVHDAGLGLQFATNSFPEPTLDGVVYEGVLDLSEPSAHLAVRDAFSVTGTAGTGAGVINVTGSGANLTLVGSRTLDAATLRLGNASINISNPGTTTAVTFGSGLTIRQAGVASFSGVGSSIGGTGQFADSLLNDGSIFGSLQNGQLTISGIGSFTNAGSIGFSNGDNLTITAGTVTNQTSITLGNGVIGAFTGTIGFNNPGVISAGFGDSVSISAPTVTNAGTMLVGTGSTLSIGNFTSFANAGSIGIAGGATLNIGSSSAAWSSTGTITATNGTVNLQGIVKQTQIAAITRTGGAGVIDIAGTLNDAGATLSVGTGSAFGSLELSGTIAGGTIHDAGGGLTFISANGGFGASPVLDGVTYQGVVDLSESGAHLSVLDEITLTGTAGTGAGTVNLTGTGASMLFTGSATVDNATVNLGAAGGSFFSQGATLGSAQNFFGGGAVLLTLGHTLVVQQAGQSATLQGPTNVTDMLINRGIVNAGISGGSMTISGNQFENLGTVTVSNGELLAITASSFINPGTVNVLTGATLNVGSGGDWISTGRVNETNATVLLEGDVTLPEIKSVTRSGGTLVIGGRFDNQGGTLAVGTGSALGDLVLAGTLDNGIVHDNGGGFVFQNGTLDNVAYRGTVNLSTAGASLTVLGGLTATDVTGTLAGTINLTGAGSQLILQQPQVFGGATVDIGNAAGATIKVTQPFFGGGPWTTTFAKKSDIVQTGSSATLAAANGTGDILSNQGTIAATFAGGTFTISGNDVGNSGSILVSNGDVLNLTATTFSNGGTVAVTTGGVLNLGTAQFFGFGTLTTWTSFGKLNENGGAINLNGPVTLANLNSITRTGGTITLAGTADLGGGVLNVGGASTLGALVVTGAIQNGTIHDADPGLVFTTGTLTNVTYRGTMDLSEPHSSVTLAGAIAFDALTGTTPGTIKLTGAGSTMTTEGTMTLDNANLALGGATLVATPVTDFNSTLNPGGAQLTLGPKLSITHTKSSDGTTGLSSISSTTGFSFGASPGSVTNQGVITAGLAGGFLNISGGSFTNQGKLAVAAGDAVVVSANTFTNTGSMTVNAASLTIGGTNSSTVFNNTGTVAVTVTGGGTLNIGAPNAGTFNQVTWTGTDTIHETGSAINLNSQETLANLNAITRSGGTVTLAGTADLGGGVLNVGGTSTLGALVLTGVLQNGTVNDADPGLLFQGISAALRNIIYHGTMDMSAAASVVTVTGGLGLAGLGGTGTALIKLTGAGSVLNMVGSATLGNALVNLGGGASLLAITGSGSGTPQLTLASTLEVVHTGGNATIGSATSFFGVTPAAIINLGSIAAAAAGGVFTITGGSFVNQGAITVSGTDTLTINSTSFTNMASGALTVTSGGVLNLGQLFNTTTWSNAGALSETNATINLLGASTLGGLATITRTAGMITFQGVLNGGSGVLNVGSGSKLGTLQDTGTITNTIVHDAGSGLLFFGPPSSVGAVLNGDTYQGTMNMSSALARLTIINGLTATGLGGTGNGMINLTGALAALTVQGTTTLNNMTINIGNSVPFGSTLIQTDPTALGAVLTLGSGLTINQVGANANFFGARNLGDKIVNNGNVNAKVAGGAFVIAGGGLTNAGSMTIGNGDTMTVTTDTPVINNGTVHATGGGTADFAAPIDPASTGLFILDNHSVMDFAADTGAANKMSFLGSSSKLAIDAVGQFGTNVGLASYTGPLLEGFIATNSVDLKDLVFAGAVVDSYTPGTGLLQLHSGTTKATLLLQNSSLGGGTFHLGNDGNGDVLLTHS